MRLRNGNSSRYSAASFCQLAARQFVIASPTLVGGCCSSAVHRQVHRSANSRGRGKRQRFARHRFASKGRRVVPNWPRSEWQNKVPVVGARDLLYVGTDADLCSCLSASDRHLLNGYQEHSSKGGKMKFRAPKTQLLFATIVVGSIAIAVPLSIFGIIGVLWRAFKSWARPNRPVVSEKIRRSVAAVESRIAGVSPGTASAKEDTTVY